MSSVYASLAPLRGRSGTVEATIDERILGRLLDRIKIFESSVGALEPIIAASAPKVLQAGFDFSLSKEQREQKVVEALAALSLSWWCRRADLPAAERGEHHTMRQGLAALRHAGL